MATTVPDHTLATWGESVARHHTPASPPSFQAEAGHRASRCSPLPLYIGIPEHPVQGRERQKDRWSGLLQRQAFFTARVHRRSPATVNVPWCLSLQTPKGFSGWSKDPTLKLLSSLCPRSPSVQCVGCQGATPPWKLVAISLSHRTWQGRRAMGEALRFPWSCELVPPCTVVTLCQLCVS